MELSEPSYDGIHQVRDERVADEPVPDLGKDALDEIPHVGEDARDDPPGTLEDRNDGLPAAPKEVLDPGPGRGPGEGEDTHDNLDDALDHMTGSFNTVGLGSTDPLARGPHVA